MTIPAYLTLRQGWEQFCQEHVGHLSHEQAGLPQDVKEFFLAHDMAHVLFGCDISLCGEGAVKIWTLFGTTLGLRGHIRAYRKAQTFDLSLRFTFGHIVRHILPLLFSVPLLIIRARQMNEPWPWSNYNAYLDRPIAEIREEFGIRVL